jgi:hypothetical protein
MGIAIANGQMAASATAVVTNVQGDQAVSVVAANTSGSLTETVLVTILRGATTIRVRRVVLSANYQFQLTGIQLKNGDNLQLQTTDATTVDYQVQPSSSTEMQCTVYDGTGAIVQTSGVGGPVTATTITGSVAANVAALGSAFNNAGALSSGFTTYPCTAFDNTKGVQINANDQVTNRMIWIGNLTNAKVIVYPPNSGQIAVLGVNNGYTGIAGGSVWAFCIDSASGRWVCGG